MVPPPKEKDSLTNPKTPIGISRLPPPFPSVRLPNHPPLSPACTGSGFCSPTVSSVITCPLSIQQGPITPNLDNDGLEGTPASSLDWDNFQSTPEFSSNKIPIVSTICSSLEGIELSLSPTVSQSGSVFVSPQFIQPISEMETEAGELSDSKIVILCEISDNPVSNIRPGMEAMAEKDVSRILEINQISS